MGLRISRLVIIVVGLSLLVLFAAALIFAPLNNTTSSVSVAAPTAIASGSAALSNASNRPGWQTIPFVNVRTNQPMTLADFAGKTVVVQIISVWCANCTEQHKQTAQALAKLGAAAPVYISLDIDIAHPHDDAQTVADYAAREQFPWIFAISNKQFTNVLIDQFGFNILNGPITPIFVISPDGKTSRLSVGILNPDALINLIQADVKG